MTTPHDGLTHLKTYDVKDSNVELIGSDLDHKVKYKSASTEPAWNNGTVGRTAGLFVWRIEEFQVVPWPRQRYGDFYEGDSYIVLRSYKIGQQEDLSHEIFFWLGAKTTQDEAGTAAYKTVELDEFLRGAATQHRELQAQPSSDFLQLFPRITILSGGVRSGFTHVEEKTEPENVLRLLRIVKAPHGQTPSGRTATMVYEVEPTWRSLDEDDVFILDQGKKIWVWQGQKCSPIEKAKAAEVVHGMTLEKKIDTEVLAQAESRSHLIIEQLGGDASTPPITSAQSPHPTRDATSALASGAARKRPRRLFRLSDASGQLLFDLVKNGNEIQRADLDGNDVFLLDTGLHIWVWQGSGASKTERSMWIKVGQAYVRSLEDQQVEAQAHLTPMATVKEGKEPAAFWKALEDSN